MWLRGKETLGSISTLSNLVFSQQAWSLHVRTPSMIIIYLSLSLIAEKTRSEGKIKLSPSFGILIPLKLSRILSNWTLQKQSDGGRQKRRARPLLDCKQTFYKAWIC